MTEAELKAAEAAEAKANFESQRFIYTEWAGEVGTTGKEVFLSVMVGKKEHRITLVGPSDPDECIPATFVGNQMWVFGIGEYESPEAAGTPGVPPKSIAVQQMHEVRS